MPHTHVKQIVVKDILVLHQLFTTSQFSNEIDTLNSGDENDYVYIRRALFMVCKQRSIFGNNLPLKYVEYKMSSRFVIRYTLISTVNIYWFCVKIS